MSAVASESDILLELLNHVEALICDSVVSFWLDDELILEWRELPDLKESRIANGEQTFALRELIQAIHIWATKNNT